MSQPDPSQFPRPVEPMLNVFSSRWAAGALVTILAQLALGIWLFAASGRLSSIRPLGYRR